MTQSDVSYARKVGSLQGYKPSQLAQRKGAVIVIGGASNAGKTSLLMTLWESKRIKTVLLGDARGRAHVLPDYEGLTVVPLKTWADWNEFIKYVTDHPTEFDVVVIDTWSEIQGIDLKQRGLYGADDKHRFKIYGESHMDMSDTARKMYDIAAQYGVHFILTTWLKDKKDDKTGVESLRLYLTDSFEVYFRGIVDYIGVLRLNEIGVRPYPGVLSFEPSNTSPQKFSPPAADAERIGRIPRTIYQPSLGHILDCIVGDEFPVEEHKLKRPT
jgi:hypothetical protein